MDNLDNMDKAYQYKSPAFWLTQETCPIKTVDQCIYQTTGDLTCQGKITSGANDKISNDKITASTNERMLSIALDSKVWK